MDLFEARSDRGLEQRVDEGDLRNLYRAGFLHLDSLVRRSGSPNWFRVDEMFPQFETIPSAKKYSANFKKNHVDSGARAGILMAFGVVVLIVLLVHFSRKIGDDSNTVPTPATQREGR